MIQIQRRSFPVERHHSGRAAFLCNPCPAQGRGLIALHGPCLSNVVHQPVIVRGIRLPLAGNSQVLMILDHMARSDRDISVSRMDAVLMNFLRQALWQ